MENSYKLYKVTCRGMQSSATGTVHGVAFVVALDPTAAYLKMRGYLESEDIGFGRDRELLSVELIAEVGDHPDCQVRLFV